MKRKPKKTRVVTPTYVGPPVNAVFRVPAPPKVVVLKPRYSKNPRYIRTRRYKKIYRRIPGLRSLNISEPVGYDVTNVSVGTDTAGNSPLSSTRTYVHVGNNTRVGVANPRWKDQIRAGSNATTSLSGTEYNFERSYWSGYSIGQSVFQSNGNLARLWNYVSSGFPQYSLPGAGTASGSIIADVHNRCIARFIDSVNAARSSENLTGRSIKHFKHDVHSTLHPMSGIREKLNSYLTKLEKVPYGKLKSPSLYSTITQAYLEFKFGVEPFVTDISDIVSDMVIRDRKRNESEPVFASAKNTYSGQHIPRNTFNAGAMAGFQPRYDMLITSTYSERIKGAVRTGINGQGHLGVIQDNRLLPSDWLPTIFSILPYAWMVNYFTNIREIIDAASFRYSDLVWAQLTTRDITKVSIPDIYFISPNPVNPAFPQYQNFATITSGGNAYFEIKTMQRLPISPSSLVPTFAFSIPTSATPWVNMVAAFSPRIFSIVRKFTT